MRTIVLLLISVLLLQVSNAQFLFEKMSSKFSNAGEMKWEKGNKVTLSNFTVVDTMDNNRVARASTAIYLDYNYRNSGNIRAYCVWSKPNSVIKSSITSNEDSLNKILRHEQGHFDITEYITKCINKELIGIKSPRIADSIYNSQIERWDTIQRLYDVQTNHHTIQPSQEKWEQMIEKWLGNQY